VGNIGKDGLTKKIHINKVTEIRKGKKNGEGG